MKTNFYTVLSLASIFLPFLFLNVNSSSASEVSKPSGSTSGQMPSAQPNPSCGAGTQKPASQCGSQGSSKCPSQNCGAQGSGKQSKDSKICDRCDKPLVCANCKKPASS